MTGMTTGDPQATATTTPEWGAKNEAGTLLVVGILVAVVGAAIMVAAWPGTEVTVGAADDLFSTGSKETGSMPLTLLGAALAVCGQVAGTIGMIAFGVRLGTRP